MPTSEQPPTTMSRSAAATGPFGPPAIVADEVEVQFRRRRAAPARALDGLSLHIATGTVFCLLGPNGSGKTTVINLLIGLLRPDRGNVQVLGLEPVRHRQELLRRIAVVPQETALYDQLSGRENLAFHASYHGVERRLQRQRVDEALALVSLVDAGEERVARYSGGMRRRLMLGRALLTDPELVFLDEPTLGVDVQSRQAIWERIDALANAGRTAVVTTNLMEEAERLGRDLVILDRGAAVAAGRPPELKALAGGRRLTLTCATESTARQVAQRLGPRILALRHGAVVTVELRDAGAGTQLVAELLSYLDGVAAQITAVELAEPTLQDVFLGVTGRDLRDGS